MNWSCELCGKEFQRQRSVEQHKTATKGSCAIDDVKEWNETLRHFHDDKANLCVGARRKSKGVVQSVLSDILNDRYNKGRFETEAVLEGSYKTGLKIGKPDEFDFSVQIILPPSHKVTADQSVGFQYADDDIDLYSQSSTKRQLIEDREVGNLYNLGDASAPVGYQVVQLKQRKRGRFKQAIIHDMLVPYEVLVQFHKFVSGAVHSLGDSGVTVCKTARGPAISLLIRDPDIFHTISVDVAPVVYVGEAGPYLEQNDWPRLKTSKWLTEDKISAVNDTEIYLVPKGDKFWKVSFARCEDEILRDIDGPRLDGTRKTCLRICKMKLKQWKSKSTNGLKAISSYMLKTLMLWLCESIPFDEDWCESQLAVRYYNFLLNLHHCLNNRYLGEYFVPDINLLDEKDDDEIEEMIDFVEEEMKSMGANVPDTDYVQELFPFEFREP